MIPISLKECPKALLSELSDDELKVFVNTKKDDLINYHHSLGTMIRNNWNLWRGGLLPDELRKLGITHPDDMSHYIIGYCWNIIKAGYTGDDPINKMRFLNDKL